MLNSCLFEKRFLKSSQKLENIRKECQNLKKFKNKSVIFNLWQIWHSFFSVFSLLMGFHEKICIYTLILYGKLYHFKQKLGFYENHKSQNPYF